jgi:hypothetical protein
VRLDADYPSTGVNLLRRITASTLVFVFRHGQQDHVRLGRYGRKRGNVWSYPDLNSFSRTGSEGNFSCT